jgi:hypothetical protein
MSKPDLLYRIKKYSKRKTCTHGQFTCKKKVGHKNQPIESVISKPFYSQNMFSFSARHDLSLIISLRLLTFDR